MSRLYETKKSSNSMNDEQSQSEASGIFTMDGASSAAGHQAKHNPFDVNSTDDGSEILSNYPGLDDDNTTDDVDGMSGIISTSAASGGVDGVSAATSDIYTANHSDGGGGGRKKGTEFDALYDLESSTTGGNTNDIIGQYGAKSGGSSKDSPSSKKNSWLTGLTDTLSMIGIPIQTLPTADSSPAKSEQNGLLRDHKRGDDEEEEDSRPAAATTAASAIKSDDLSALSYDASGITSGKRAGATTSRAPPAGPAAAPQAVTPPPQETKLCGFDVKSVILVSLCLVIVAMIVIIVSVVLVNNDDDSTASSESGRGNADFGDFLTAVPTEGLTTFPTFPAASPGTSPNSPSPTLVPTISRCPPDSFSDSFMVDLTIVDCMWVQGRNETYKQELCGSNTIIASVCQRTCDSCETNGLTLSPTSTRVPVVSSTISPTILPTAVPTNDPTNGPTNGPTNAPTNAPANGPTNGPTNAPSIPLITQFPTSLTEAPTSLPTGQPSAFPTQRPTPSPTFPPTPQPTGLPTLIPTGAPSGLPTLLPTLSPVIGSRPPTPRPSFQPTNSPTLTLSPTLSFLPTLSLAPTPRPTTSPTIPPTAVVNCEPDQPGTIPGELFSRTCSWLSQTSREFRLNACQPDGGAFEHCPTTCRSCDPSNQV